MKAASAGKWENVRRNGSAGFKHTLPHGFQIRGKNNDQGFGRLMFPGAIDAGSDAAVLRIGIIVAPRLIFPAEHVAVKLFCGQMRRVRGGGELDVIDLVLA